MARKKKAPPAGPNMGYLVSFGDTMTALLAFFIVLLSLSTEQTGMNMYAGSGSFSKATRGFGLPGKFKSDKTDQPFSMNEATPLYLVDDPDNPEKSKLGTGPDAEKNQIRTIDREAEDFQRFLYELEHKFGVPDKQESSHNMVFDLFGPIDFKGKLIPDSARQVITDAMPLISAEGHRMEIIIWPKMPSPKMIRISAIHAVEIHKMLVNDFQLDEEQARRLTSISRPWMDSVAKRPTISIVVTKL